MINGRNCFGYQLMQFWRIIADKSIRFNRDDCHLTGASSSLVSCTCVVANKYCKVRFYSNILPNALMYDCKRPRLYTFVIGEKHLDLSLQIKDILLMLWQCYIQPPAGGVAVRFDPPDPNLACYEVVKKLACSDAGPTKTQLMVVKRRLIGGLSSSPLWIRHFDSISPSRSLRENQSGYLGPSLLRPWTTHCKARSASRAPFR